MKASEEMNDNITYNPNDILEKTYRLKGVSPMDRIEMQRGNITYVVKVIKCYHIVPCVGYLFF